jgi:uncharacterized protein with HEPN domain
MTEQLAVCVDDILDAISAIEEVLQGMAYEEYRTDRKTKIYVVQNFEKIINAVNMISHEDKNAYPDIPWSDIESFQTKLISPNIGVDDKIVWKASKVELKHLYKLIKNVFFKL